MSVTITLGRIGAGRTGVRTFGETDEWGVPYSGVELSVRGWYCSIKKQ